MRQTWSLGCWRVARGGVILAIGRGVQRSHVGRWIGRLILDGCGGDVAVVALGGRNGGEPMMGRTRSALGPGQSRGEEQEQSGGAEVKQAAAPADGVEERVNLRFTHGW